MTDIEKLPLETLIEILTKIDGKSLGRSRRVCRKWKECIDGVDSLWQKLCEKDFPESSRIAKRKSGTSFKWYHIYRNLIMWADISRFETDVKEFYKFSIHDKTHLLEIDYGVLALSDLKGLVLYDVSTLKYIPVSIPDGFCSKMSNNDHATIILTRTGVIVQRSANLTPEDEQYLRADDFILTEDHFYIHRNRDVFRCDYNAQNLDPELIMHCQYKIKTMVHYNGSLQIFTDCGKVVTINKNNEVKVNPISCPAEWIPQIKHISAVNDKNFVCYSRNLIKVETNKYKHLYLDFPPITALFFYVDIILIGTGKREILLYKLSSQKKAMKPIFETIAVLPEGKIPLQLDVVERKNGPLIAASTSFELYLIEIKFFPNEKPKQSFTPDKHTMYKRLHRLKKEFYL
ncbi:uncharacterized protein LOC116775734 [Danaus plexippus]|uniref:uncharacterized protein LOC116775734 n=1 Tax=Danaus plexippus TaxID=13037 RepID=UPI002AAFFB56|nr:uncharacterized protein LOC116775734 [Danaus plexippus]